MRTLLAAVAAAAAFLLATASYGQTPPWSYGQTPPCGPRSEIEKALADQYRERLRVQAIRDNGSVLLIYVADDDTTYTVATMAPNVNNVCVLDSGAFWSLQKTAPSREG